jgi:hypothetical protein
LLVSAQQSGTGRLVADISLVTPGSSEQRQVEARECVGYVRRLPGCWWCWPKSTRQPSAPEHLRLRRSPARARPQRWEHRPRLRTLPRPQRARLDLLNHLAREPSLALRAARAGNSGQSWWLGLAWSTPSRSARRSRRASVSAASIWLRRSTPSRVVGCRKFGSAAPS